jgi:hypothetical protein
LYNKNKGDTMQLTESAKKGILRDKGCSAHMRMSEMYGFLSNAPENVALREDIQEALEAIEKVLRRLQ